MSHQYEIEIKSFLGNKDKADLLSEKIVERGGVKTSQNKQLNHYFIVADVSRFKDKLLPYIDDSKKDSFINILEEGSNFSIRTRDTDGKVLLVVKASIGDDSSSNGVSRMEFEAEMNMSLDDLDKILLDSGLEYQAKWSREREEYRLN